MDAALESGSDLPILNLATTAFQSDEYKLARNSGGIFLNAILRKDTGAAITKPEQTMAEKFYLPVPNDSKIVLKAKELARVQAVEALRSILPEGSEKFRTEGDRLTEEEFAQVMAFSKQAYDTALKQLTDGQAQAGLLRLKALG